MSTRPRPTEKSSMENKSPTAEAHPTREEIELLAYQFYIERGCPDGHDVDDWLQAEQELVEKHANTGRIAKGARA